MEQVDTLAKKIWHYMLMHQELKKADALIVLGSVDIRVADRAGELYKQGFANKVICTGGMAHQDDINNPGWDKPESAVYKERLISLGIPEADIFIETEARSTGDNALLVKKFVQENNLPWKNFIVVSKPPMERRSYATFKKQYPEAGVCVTSQNISYEDFMNSPVSRDVLMNVMVGDLLRIREYPKLGFQIEQEIPDDVWQAGQELLKLGYDKYAIK